MVKKADGSFAGSVTILRVPLGAGGYITAGVRLANDGWKVCGGDATGFWVRGPNDTKWTDLIAVGIMPSAYIGVDRINGAADNYMGTWACDICKTDSTRAYAVINGYAYKFDRSGNNWTATRLTNKGPWAQSGCSDNNAWGPGRMRVDPQNKDVFAFLTRDGKMVVSTDGGTTMTELTITTVSTGKVYVDVDPTSTVTGGVLQRWFRNVPGTGVQMSTTGPAGTYTTVTGTPTDVCCLYVDAQGQCWVCDDTVASDNLYKWTSASGTFTKISTADISPYKMSWITADPATSGASQHLVLMSGSGFFQSYDGGSTFIGYWNQQQSWNHTYNGATSIAWQGTFPVGGKKAGSGVNPTNGVAGGMFENTGGKFWGSTGIGTVIIHSFPTVCSSAEANAIRIYETAEGLDMLITSDLAYPSGYPPLVSTWDRYTFQISDRYRYTNQPNAYNYGATDGSLGQLNHGYTLAVCPGHPNIVIQGVGLNQQDHCASYDGGTTWTKKFDHPDGGSIWPNFSFQDPDRVIWMSAANQRMAYTTNFSASVPTWAVLTGATAPYNTKGRGIIGAGTSAVRMSSVADWVPGGTQAYTVTVNAASGAGSVVDNVGAKTCVVTPPSGTTTAAQLVTYINANSAMITAAATGGGTGAMATGSVVLSYESGLSYSPFDTFRRSLRSDSYGNSYLYNYGPGPDSLLSAQFRGLWVLPNGADPITGWVKKGGNITGGGDTAGMQLAIVDNPGGSGISQEVYAKGYIGQTGLYKSSTDLTTMSLVTNTSNVSAVAVGPIPPGKTRPAIAFAGKYNGAIGVWIYEGTVPGTDAPRKLFDYALANPDTIICLEFNPKAYDPNSTDRCLLIGAWQATGAFLVYDNLAFTAS